METQMYLAQSSGAKLVMLEHEHIRVCELDARVEWKIGRFDPNQPNRPNILFSSGIVSREHGWLRNIDGQWYYVDNPRNLNGTFHNGKKIPRTGKQHVLLNNGDILRIDNVPRQENKKRWQCRAEGSLGGCRHSQCQREIRS